MTILRFTGQIFPRALTLAVTNYPTLKVWDYNKKADVGTIDISIDNNEIAIVVNLTEIDETSELGALANANDAVDAIVSLASFQSGQGFSFIIDKIHYEDGQISDLAIAEPSLAKLTTALRSETDVNTIVRLINDDKMLFLALRDLAESIRIRHSALINFARAIETIRNRFVPKGAEPEEGWAPMRSSLNLSKPFLQKITNASRNPRHGRRQWIQPPYGSLQEMAWQVMNRFLEYRKRGDHPLPVSEFPLLD
jgi:hypothetical protein